MLIYIRYYVDIYRKLCWPTYDTYICITYQVFLWVVLITITYKTWIQYLLRHTLYQNYKCSVICMHSCDVYLHEVILLHIRVHVLIRQFICIYSYHDSSCVCIHTTAPLITATYYWWPIIFRLRTHKRWKGHKLLQKPLLW